MAPVEDVSRRRFLRVLGAVGGAGATLAAMDVLGLTPDVRRHTAPFRAPRSSDFHLRGSVNDTTVLVLGAGIAGLATAYELEKAGYRCEVLEARDRPGGRNWTVRGGARETDLDGNLQVAGFAEDQYMNAGPARIPQFHTTLDYCRELAVPIEVFVNANPDAYVLRESGVDASGRLTGRAVSRRAAKADYNGYVSELLAKATHQGSLDAVLSRDDRDALVEYLRSAGALSSHDTYRGSDRRGYRRPPGAGNEPGTVAAPFPLSELLASGLGTSFAFEQGWDQAMPMFQPVGGMDRIPYALAAAIRGQVRYGARVRDIRVLRDRVAVDYADASGTTYEVSGDYCVCTIPPTVLRTIPNNFPTTVVTSLTDLSAMSTGKIGLQYRRRFWEEDADIYGGITDTNLDIGTIWYPSSGFNGRRGVVIGYYNYFEQSDSFAALTPRERERHALEQGVRIHGNPYRSEFEMSFSVHWQRAEFSEGGWVLWEDRATSPGYQKLLEPVGPLYFAGDHLSYVTAWQHGALESARYVVTALHQRALSAAGGSR